MFFIDTHTHLNDPDLYEERDAVMGRAREEGVGLLLVASYDLLSAKRALLLAEEYPECRPAIGLHPENLEESSPGDWEDIQALASRNEVLAIGETGLDYHWVKDEGLRARQRKLFIEHIELADALGLPLTIHSRDAAEDMLKILQEHTPKHGAVMHCYGYSAQMVPAFARLGMYFGFGGVLCAVIIYIPCFLASVLSCYFVAEAYGCVAKKYVFFTPARPSAREQASIVLPVV